MWFITAVVFSTAIQTIVPFVRIYTQSITDANYIRFIFAIVLISAEAIYCLRDPYISTIYSSGHFKQTKWSSYLEAIINIIFSLVLIKRFGIEGIAFGTLCGMLFRAVYSAIYVNKHLVQGTVKQFFYFVLTYAILSGVSIIIGLRILPIEITDFAHWTLISCFLCLVNILAVGLFSLLCFRDTAKRTITTLMTKRR